jgi:hypothetical protein
VSVRRFVRTCIPGARAVTLRRSEYATSHRIDDVDVRCRNGDELQLVLKRSGDMLPESQGKRPAFLVDPAREARVYRSILDHAGIGTPRFHGARREGRDGHWLLIERVRGAQLCHVGDRAFWEDAARWLARMHVTLAPFAHASAADALIRHDDDFYRTWPARAIAFHPSHGLSIERLTRRWDEVVERLVSLPRTVIHGECYASNVLVDGRTGRVCAVDWEMAAVGPAVVDLAALTSGWEGGDLAALIGAYRTELARRGVADPYEDLEQSLALCRLYFCLQWLGWSRGWEPPEDQTNDWLGEALELAEASGL